jgi:peptidoglycan hydrolase CwlO-like protein
MTKVKSKEYTEMQENYSKLQSKVQSKNNEIDLLINKINSLESKYILSYQELTRLPVTSTEF